MCSKLALGSEYKAAVAIVCVCVSKGGTVIVAVYVCFKEQHMMHNR